MGKREAAKELRKLARWLLGKIKCVDGNRMDYPVEWRAGYRFAVSQVKDEARRRAKKLEGKTDA